MSRHFFLFPLLEFSSFFFKFLEKDFPADEGLLPFPPFLQMFFFPRRRKVERYVRLQFPPFSRVFFLLTQKTEKGLPIRSRLSGPPFFPFGQCLSPPDGFNKYVKAGDGFLLDASLFPPFSLRRNIFSLHPPPAISQGKEED